MSQLRTIEQSSSIINEFEIMRGRSPTMRNLYFIITFATRFVFASAALNVENPHDGSH